MLSECVYVCVYVCVCGLFCGHVLYLYVCASSPDLAKASDLVLQCSSVWNTTSSMFTYNFTWTLNYPPSVLDAFNTATLSLLRPRGGGGGGGSSMTTIAQITVLVCHLVLSWDVCTCVLVCMCVNIVMVYVCCDGVCYGGVCVVMVCVVMLCVVMVCVVMVCVVMVCVL